MFILRKLVVHKSPDLLTYQGHLADQELWRSIKKMTIKKWMIISNIVSICRDQDPNQLKRKACIIHKHLLNRQFIRVRPINHHQDLKW